MGVDGQRGRGGGVSEALTYRPDRDAAVEEAGGDVVAEVVEADGLQADLLPQLREAAGGAGVGPPLALGRVDGGEDLLRFTLRAVDRARQVALFARDLVATDVDVHSPRITTAHQMPSHGDQCRASSITILHFPLPGRRASKTRI